MYKIVQTNPGKFLKFNTTLLLFYVDTRIFLKAIRGRGYHFIPKGGTFTTETIRLVVRSSGLWEAYTQTCPKWDKTFTKTCWCRSMIACQVSLISDEFWIYYNLKTKDLNVCGRVTVAGCLKFIPISCMGPKHAPKDTYLIFNQFICTGACVCSSNLNYAHKMPRKAS